MRRLLLPALVAALALTLAAAPAGAAKRKLSLTAAKAKVLKDFRSAYDVGTYRVTCKRAKSGRAASCLLVRTAGAGPCGGRGTAKLTKAGKVKVSTWPLADCTGIPGAGVTIPVGGDAPPVAGGPAVPAEPAGPITQAPDKPAAGALSGTYVCLTGIIGQVRPAGPDSIDPIPVPATGIEPPLKFTLSPDGTYRNITFGAAYANDPKWGGTYTVVDGLVTLVTAGGANLVSGPFRQKTDTAGTRYLIEERPANEAYLANVCRAIA